MKKCKTIVFLYLVFGFIVLLQGEIKFDDYFEDKTMRIDYYHIADKITEFINIDKIYQQGIWAGSLNSLIDTFNNGNYYIKIYDNESFKLIYSRGFNSYCGEYITTDKAAKGIKRTFHETSLIPFPKKKIKFTIERRNRKNQLYPIFSQILNPKSIDINKESLIEGVNVFEILKNGDSHKKLDLAFIAEGYRKSEERKFKEDLQRMTAEFFKQEPFKSYKTEFNIYGLFKPSKESGPDEPGMGIYRNTVVGTSFNALGLHRYMLTEDNRAYRDISAHVPYDSIIIMVNSQRYGGGGIYNFYCIFSCDNHWSVYLLLHEFGHSFAGLADEYYASSVAYNEFYPKGIEPTEPNITALLKPEQLKWKHHVKKSTKIPTPWGKEKFDQLERKEKLSFLKNKASELKDTIGAFEGAGYSSEGFYRPMVNCIMFSKGEIHFCKVCKEGIIKMIKHYIR